MTRRKRTGTIVVLAVTALLVIAGVAYAAGVFPDVSETDTHFSAIEWAAANGVVNGYTNGNFGPYDNILRGQAATMFKNYDTYLRGSLPSGGGVDGCKDCHDDSTLITGKQATWETSNHGENTSYLRATSADCAGCHSGGAFSAVIAAGMGVEDASADPDPTRQECRACHQVHETGTAADWALETTAAVDLFAVDVTYDGGKGNLCANCHQPRREFPEAVGGMITGISSHWGPHHGPQSSTLLGVAGAGVSDGVPMLHYTAVADTCVGCHTADVRSHTFAADIEACQTCHVGAEDFDIGGTQTEVQTRLDAIGAELLALDLINENSLDGHPTVTEAPEDQAIALYNWLYVGHEDKSLGVHNPAYVRALLTAAEDALGI